jgi:hypothetical protein
LTRFVGVIGGLADPRALSPCVSPTGLPRRRSWVYRTKDERRTCLVDLLVGLAVGASSHVSSHTTPDLLPMAPRRVTLAP